MKKTKFSESQIVNILKEAEAGVRLDDLIRQHGFSKASLGEYVHDEIYGENNRTSQFQTDKPLSS